MIRIGPFLVLLPLLALSAGGCQTAPREQLIGAWTTRHPVAGPNTIIFRRDNTIIWRFDGGGATASTHRLQYTLDAASSPMTIDIEGFSKGPLSGHQLIGIVEFVDPDTLRLDFESIPPGGDTEERPSDFRRSATTYRRTHGVAHQLVGWLVPDPEPQRPG